MHLVRTSRSVKIPASTGPSMARTHEAFPSCMMVTAARTVAAGETCGGASRGRPASCWSINNLSGERSIGTCLGLATELRQVHGLGTPKAKCLTSHSVRRIRWMRSHRGCDSDFCASTTLARTGQRPRLSQPGVKPRVRAERNHRAESPSYRGPGSASRKTLNCTPASPGMRQSGPTHPRCGAFAPGWDSAAAIGLKRG